MTYSYYWYGMSHGLNNFCASSSSRKIKIQVRGNDNTDSFLHRLLCHQTYVLLYSTCEPRTPTSVLVRSSTTMPISYVRSTTYNDVSCSLSARSCRKSNVEYGTNRYVEPDLPQSESGFLTDAYQSTPHQIKPFGQSAVLL